MTYETTPEGQAALAEMAVDTCSRVRPPPKLSVDEWADRFRKLSPEASAEPGQWHNARAPYLVDPMRACSPLDPAQIVVVMFPSQDGKTEIQLNFLGYIIDQDPGPCLVTQPNVKPMAETFSKDRLAPMLRDTPRLQGKVKEARSRDSGNTIYHKQFAGGHITINGANSPAGMASRPIRYFLGDELNRWPDSAGTEGSPYDLGEKRTRRFWNRKILLVSSPTFENVGIHAQYERSDKAQWQLACKHCGKYQFPRLRHLVAKERPDDPTDLSAEMVVYACEHCGGEHTHVDEHTVKASGKWVVEMPGRDVRGFWKTGISSTFTSWAAVLREFFTVKDVPEQLQVFTNTVLCENWLGPAEGVEDSALVKRQALSADEYDAAVPDGVELLVAGVDVQKDRLEMEVVGYNSERTTWGIIYRVLWGETNESDVWQQLDDALSEQFGKADGSQLGVSAACIDSGYNAQHVYDFVHGKKARHIIATKGRGGSNIPVISAPTKQRTASAKHKRKTPVFTVGVDLVKGVIYGRLKKTDPAQPGYCHFPGEYTEQYFAGLTGEHLVRRVVKGVLRHLWELRTPSTRNEQLDCRVLAEAALWYLSPRWLRLPAGTRSKPKRAKPTAQATVARQVTEAHQKRVRGRRPRAGFVKRY